MDTAQVSADTAERPRDDVKMVANQLAKLWRQLSGKRFPKSLHRTPDPDNTSGTLKEFKEPGPRFVCAVAQVIDPEITFEQVDSALRKRALDPPGVPPSS